MVTARSPPACPPRRSHRPREWSRRQGQLHPT